MKLPKIKRDRKYYLRVFRAEYDLSQKEAGDLFGVSASHWSLMENGERTPSPDVAALLASVIRQPIEVFLNVKVTKAS